MTLGQLQAGMAPILKFLISGLELQRFCCCDRSVPLKVQLLSVTFGKPQTGLLAGRAVFGSYLGATICRFKTRSISPAPVASVASLYSHLNCI